MLSPALPELTLSVPRRHILAALFWRDYLNKRSYRGALAFDALYGGLTLTIYFFISRFFGEPNRAALNDAPSYFAFAAMGIIAGAMVLSIAADVARGLRDEQLAGTLEALAGQPLSSTELCLGFVAFPFAFAFVRALVYFVIASAAMDLDLLDVSWIGLVVTLLGAGAVFSALAIVVAAIVLVVKRGEAIAALLVSVLTVFSGSVFPITTLPGWLEPVARVLPTRIAFDGVRNAVFRGDGWGLDALALICVAALGIPIAASVFGLALRTAQRSGSLGQY